MKRIIYIALIALFFFSASRSKADPLPIDLNACAFRLDENSSRWELYYSFPENAIKFINKDSLFEGNLTFSIKFISPLKTEVEDTWTINHRVLQAPDSFKMKLFGLRAFELKSGQYRVELTIDDPNDENIADTVKFPIIINKYHNDRLEMSDMMLSTLILREDEAGNLANKMFWKNSLYVYPNPAAEYFGNDPTLKLYTEIYNAKAVSPNGLELHYRIFDGANREIYYFPKSKPALHDGLVEQIEIPLNSMPTGVYNVVLSIKAKGCADSIYQKAKFYLFNYSIPPALDIKNTIDQGFESSEFATLSSERLDIEFKQVEMLATKAQKDQYDLLSTDEAKGKFLYIFWRHRNRDTISPVNMALDEHRDKIKFANTYFSYGRSDNGWNTDRGRVLLQYGEPARRDFAPQNGNERPYETWFYSAIEGGVYFYFVDVGGFGNYQLVHSTKSGEFYNTDWYEQYVPITKENRENNNDSYDSRRYR